MPNTETEPFDTVDEAVADIAAGRMVIVTDDESRENEGDLVMAADKVTPETINAMRDELLKKDARGCDERCRVHMQGAAICARKACQIRLDPRLASRGIVEEVLLLVKFWWLIVECGRIADVGMLDQPIVQR